MTHILVHKFILPAAVLAVLLGASGAFAATPGPASQYKIKGTFDIPKKEYRVGETVRGKFTVLNQERTMTMDIQKSEGGKLVYLKRKVKVKRGGRLTVPVVWVVKNSGKQVIQYSVNGSWPTGKGAIAGFSRTFEHVINKGSKEEELGTERLPALVFVPESPDAAPVPGVTTCSSMDCLIRLARSCGKSEFTYSVKSPFPFNAEMTVESRGYYRINGQDTSGKCTFLSRSRGATVTISQRGRDDALASGKSAADVDALIKAISDSMKSEEATKSVTTCTGTTANVAAFFREAAQGSADSSCTIRLGAKETRCTVAPNLSCVTRLP